MYSALLLVALVGSASAGFFFRPPPQLNPVDCQYTPWTEYSQCSEPCGKQGTQARTRQILVQSQFGGIPCDPSQLEEWRPCFTPCAVDCVMGPWSQYSQCLSNIGANCGIGQQSRSRSILVQPQNGGQPCGQTFDSKTCDLGSCAVDCVLSEWGPFSSCVTPSGETCGLGQRQRTRSILVEPQQGGKQCGVLEEWEGCNLGPCAQNCEMSLWAQWSQCQSATGQSCGLGQRQRLRSIITHPSNGGSQCGSLEEWENCNLGPCAVDCVMGPWSAYSQCLSFTGQTCGIGQQTRTRSILVQAQNGGRPCQHQSEQNTCDLGPCAQDCVMGRWQPWSQCQTRDGKTCGIGSRQRLRSIISPPLNGGAPCGQTEEWESCNLGPCAQDCVMGAWGPWSQCQTRDGKSCGFGQRQRLRSIISQPLNGGAPCGEIEEWEACNAGPCPVDCVMGEWGPYGQCSAQCGGGLQTRTRSILVQPQFGGLSCLSTVDSIPCATQPCFQPPSCIGRPVEFYINPAEPCSDKFWKCVNQETHAHTCPSGLKFDIQTFKCLHEFQVPACRRF